MKLIPDEIFAAAAQFLRGGGANACLKPTYGEQYLNQLIEILGTYCVSHRCPGWLSTDSAHKCLHDAGWWPLSIQGSPRDQTERPMIETREEAIEHIRVNNLMETEEGRAALKAEYEKKFLGNPAALPQFLDIEDTEFNKKWMKQLRWDAQRPEAVAAALKWQQEHPSGISREEAIRKSRFMTTEPGFTVKET